MEQEYTTSTGYKIFYGIAAIALAGFTIIVPATGKNGGFNGHPGLFILPLVGIIGSALILINLFKRKIIVSDYSVVRTNVWGTKEIVNKDVKGFRIGDKAIYIYPLQEGSSKISINDYISIGDDAGLKEWLSQHFTDLDKVEFEEEKEEILKDSTLGVTVEDRELKFNTIRKYVTGYSIIGVVLFTAYAILHTNSPYLSGITLIFPLIGLFLMAWGKGIVTMFAKKSSAQIPIFYGLFFSSLALVLGSLINNKLLDFKDVWTPVIIAVLIIFCVSFMLSIKNAKAKVLNQIFFILIFSATYGFGSVLAINCGFDQSTSQIFDVTVIDHYIAHGKTKSYIITIDEWRADHSSENISVSESFYDNAPVGSKVKVHKKKGVLNIPWYYITQ